jgi:hypothetical protein
MRASCVVVVAATLAACSGGLDDEVLGTVGESCAKTADCESGVKCINQTCQLAGPGCPGDTDCSELACGPDPVCGEWCGTCDSNQSCQAGHCVQSRSEDVSSSCTGTCALEENGDGTATDPSSGLTWQATPPSGVYYWEDVKPYCDSLSLGGHSDWHLPTIGELRTLIRGCPASEASGSCTVEEGSCLSKTCPCDRCESMDGPADGCFWPDEIQGSCNWLWSSSLVEDEADRVWGVDFSDADLNMGSTDDHGHVCCVR